MSKVAILCAALGYSLVAPETAGAAQPLPWSGVAAEAARGCDAFTPVLADDGRHDTSYGDCNGLTRKLTPKRGDVQQLAEEVRENRREADRRHIDNEQPPTRVEAHLLDGGPPARR